jgi:sugar lactone lactonase YvrE
MSKWTRRALGAVVGVAALFASELNVAELVADDAAKKDAVRKEAAIEEAETGDEGTIEAATDADQRAVIEALIKEQAEAAKKLETHRDSAPFHQTSEIRLAEGEGKILGFCVLANGELVVISGLSQEYGEGVVATLARTFAGKSKSVASRVQWLDASGKVIRSANLDFYPKAVNAAPDGSVLVVGAGQIARFDPKGEKLVQIESPHLAKAVANKEQFAEETLERHREETEQIKEQAAQYEEALKELKAKDAESLTRSEKAQLLQAQALQAHFANQLKAREAMKPEAVVALAMSRLKEIHRVAISDEHVFVVTNEATGYGFCVWRMNPQLGDAKKIMSGLSGCCGQMDIQVIGTQLVIAENSRHRVVVADFDGKSKLNFGNANRTDVTKGFGGCCNPMNTCWDARGYVLTSESNGLVKRYSPKGEFQSVVGVARVTEGCKNSSIGMAPDGSSLYYFDVTKGEILVLKAKS